MNTTKSSNGRNSNSQFKVIPLLVIGFTFVVLLGLTGCFESSSEDTPQPVESLPKVPDSQASEGGRSGPPGGDEPQNGLVRRGNEPGLPAGDSRTHESPLRAC